MEIVIPAQTGIGGSELSPDGRWAVWGSERREGEERSRLFIRDLTTGEDIDISDVEWRGEGRRWLADNRFIAKNHNRYWIVQLPGLEAQELNVIGEKQSMEQLAEEFALYNNVVAYKGFSISNSAVALIALDATPPLVYN